MEKIIIKMLPNGLIHVETVGMPGRKCIPYVQKVSEALSAVPLDLPDAPMPVFDFSGEEQAASSQAAQAEDWDEEAGATLRL